MPAEDIIQNVFLKLFENMNSIKNKDSINFWLFRSARNEVCIYFRNKKTRKDQFNVEDTAQLITNALDKLPPEQKEVFILREYSGFSYIEIASLLELDEALVKSRLYKTRQKLISGLKLIYQ